MSESTPNADSSIDPLQSLIADFLDAEGRGQPLDREAWLAGHPDQAASLREFLANHDRMKMVAQPQVNGSISDSATLPPTRHGQADATLPIDGSLLSMSREASVGDRVRYFGDYELLEEIARGGMGVVYKARQINLNRIVALKMILAGQLASEQDVQRFRTEAEAAANLDHPRIVPIFEVGQQAGQHYFSMGFVNGQSLAQKIIDGPMAPREAAEMLVKICEGIAYAHERGVIHRDLKPANILLDQNEQPKVTDFGLAKKLGADSNLTGTGQILGTPSYMAPEQASGQFDEVGPLAVSYQNKDKALELLGLPGGDVVQRFQGHTGYIYRSFISPDGSKLSSISDDKTMKIWDVGSGGLLHSLRCIPNGINRTGRFSLDGKGILAFDEQYLNLWNAENWEV